MRKDEVQHALEEVAQAKRQFLSAQAKFKSDVEFVMTRLLWEAAANRMSDTEVAKHASMTRRQIREMMRRLGMDPKKGRSLLAKKAADALAENAMLLGIDPSEMDLTSPLAYLPMGSELRKILEPKDDTVERCGVTASESNGVVCDQPKGHGPIRYRSDWHDSGEDWEHFDNETRTWFNVDEPVSGNRECWCGSDVGERTPGDEDGLGCLEDLNHDWRGENEEYR